MLLPVVRVGTHGGWAFGIEEVLHLFEGTREEVLRRVSGGTRAVPVGYWYDGTTSVSLFDNGELVTRYDTRLPVPHGARCSLAGSISAIVRSRVRSGGGERKPSIRPDDVDTHTDSMLFVDAYGRRIEIFIRPGNTVRL
ncbi:hypothetical protein [Nocardia suismassiliense]|uniref:hypothetical protein n=1 Tax=Nocardia suismassiliense TaxID=2077092 RepID=UPI000D1F305D|nr:hypothetical protein [Nocardia suismassiliense]